MITILKCMFSIFNLIFLFLGFSVGCCLQMILGFLLLVDNSVFFIGEIIGTIDSITKIEKILPFLNIINSTEYTYFDIYSSIIELPLFLSGIFYFISVVCSFLYFFFKKEQKVINNDAYNAEKIIKTKEN